MDHNQHAQHDSDGITEDREQKSPVYFTVLFYGLIIWGVAFCAFYLLSGWSSDAEFQQKMAAHEEQYRPAAAETPAPARQETSAVAAADRGDEAAVDGAMLYAQHCAMCHGADAEGGFGPDLTEEEYEHGRSPEAVTASIASGVGDNMPAFGDQLKDVEIKALVDYLLSL